MAAKRTDAVTVCNLKRLRKYEIRVGERLVATIYPKGPRRIAVARKRKGKT